jgi:rare lipoprotein A
MKFILLLLISQLLLTACGGGYYHTRVIETPNNRGLKSWEKPYVVNGHRYDPLRDQRGFVQKGIASWYGKDFHGKRTSDGEIYNMYAMTAAHKTLPLGVYVRVCNLENGRQTVVRINDRGPFVKGRIIDLSYAAAKSLGIVGPGTAPVRIVALGYRLKEKGGAPRYRQPPSYDVGLYAVQIGAFTIAGNAQRLAGAMKKRYGSASVQEGWVNGKRFYRVRVGHFRTMETAEAAKGRFETHGYPASFVVALE